MRIAKIKMMQAKTNQAVCGLRLSSAGTVMGVLTGGVSAFAWLSVSADGVSCEGMVIRNWHEGHLTCLPIHASWAFSAKLQCGQLN